MLRKYRNQLFNVLKDSLPFDLSYIDYEYKETLTCYDLKISVKNSGLFFTVESPKFDYHTFYHFYTEYHSPALVKTQRVVSTLIDVVCIALAQWCKKDLARWYDESILDAAREDLWTVYFEGKKNLNFNQVDFQDQEYFSHDEKKQIIMSLDAVRLKIKETDSLQLSEDGLKLIDQRIEYLKSATEKLTKFEWKSVLISTIIGITIALSLDTAKGEALIEIFKQAFVFIPKLLGVD